MPGIWAQLGLTSTAIAAFLASIGAIWFCHSRLQKHRATRLILLTLTGGLCAQLLAGPQAHERLSLRISSDCHGQSSQASFKLIEATLLPDQQRSWTVQATAASHCLQNRARLRLTVEARDSAAVQAGELFQATVKLRAPRASLQLQGFDPEGYWMAKGVSGSARLLSRPQLSGKQSSLNPLDLMRRARLAVSLWLVNTLADHPQTGLVVALVTGDQGLISPDEREVFNETGIAHLVAISGLHITLLASLSAAWLGSLWRRSQRLTGYIPAQMVGPLFGLTIASLYAVLSGWGVPAQRTLIMQLVASLMMFTGLETKTWNIWGLAMAAVLLGDPWAVRDVGFMLSFGALGVLILVSWQQYDFRQWANSTFWQAGRAQFAATIGLLPLTVWLFNQQSVVSFVANALAIPWMSFVITPLAIGGAMLRQDWAVWLAAQGLHWQALWLEWLAGWQWAVWPVAEVSFAVLIISQAGAMLLLVPSGPIPKITGTLLIGLLFLPAPRPEVGDFWVDAHDVGQGTAITIRTAQHTLLYDTGPAFSEHSNSARRVLKPFFQSEGVKQIDSLWISHDDADHTGGAGYLLRHFPTKQLVSSLPGQHHLQALAQGKQTEITHCNSAKPWVWDGVQFEPLPIHFPENLHIKDNNRSCVLRVSNSQHSVLLTGDIEGSAEKLLVEQHGSKLASNLLFAPHHGSATSSTKALLKAVQPSMVWIQSGWKNRFGHPHATVLDRYNASHVTLFNTSQFGALRAQFRHFKGPPVIVTSRQRRLRYWHLHETSASFH